MPKQRKPVKTLAERQLQEARAALKQIAKSRDIHELYQARDVALTSLRWQRAMSRRAKNRRKP